MQFWLSTLPYTDITMSNLELVSSITFFFFESHVILSDFWCFALFCLCIQQKILIKIYYILNWALDERWRFNTRFRVFVWGLFRGQEQQCSRAKVEPVADWVPCSLLLVRLTQRSRGHRGERGQFHMGGLENSRSSSSSSNSSSTRGKQTRKTELYALKHCYQLPASPRRSLRGDCAED